MQWYNGFSPEERIAKSDALKAALRNRTVMPPRGNCALCGEASDHLEHHSEDYAKDYQWTPPAMYVLCRHCHRDKIHNRFTRPEVWKAFKAHVRRGGYASEWNDPAIKREIAAFMKAGESYPLMPLRPYSGEVDREWWESRLATDPASLTAQWARPRRDAVNGSAAADRDDPKREIVLMVGCEGGGVTLYGMREGARWRFTRNVVDQTPSMLDEAEIEHNSPFVESFDEALKLMDRYPWHRLSPIKVHPDFRKTVWGAVQQRLADDDDGRERWRDRCLPRD